MTAHRVRDAAILDARGMGVDPPGWERAAFVKLARCAKIATRRIPGAARDRARAEAQNLWVAWAEAVLELRARVDAARPAEDEPSRPR